MLTRSILRELHTKSVDFIMAYTQTDTNSEVFLELPKCFGVEGGHDIEWVIRICKISMD